MNNPESVPHRAWCKLATEADNSTGAEKIKMYLLS